jgi:hypothetical protein
MAAMSTLRGSGHDDANAFSTLRQRERHRTTRPAGPDRGHHVGCGRTCGSAECVAELRVQEAGGRPVLHALGRGVKPRTFRIIVLPPGSVLDLVGGELAFRDAERVQLEARGVRTVTGEVARLVVEDDG